MAGEWLKFDCTLPEKQETLAITAAMGWDDPDTTVGKLMRLFRWFDQQTVDGNARGVTPALLDRVMGVSGFVSAVVSVGWIVVDERGLSLSNFDRHNGATAKSRVLTAKRVANHKANAAGNARGNAESVSEPLPKEEKRREEKKEDKDKKSASAPTIPEIPDSLMADFLKVRKARKAPLTETAIEGIRREAGKAGITMTKAVTACVENGWQGFRADWYAERQVKHPQRQAAPTESFAERDARHKREQWEQMSGRPWPAQDLPASARGEVIDAEPNHIRRIA